MLLPNQVSRLYVEMETINQCSCFAWRLAIDKRNINFTHLFPMHPFSTPENIGKPYGFPMFSGGRERVHLERMG